MEKDSASQQAQQSAADLERVTEYVEEQQVESSAQVNKVLHDLQKKEKASREAQAARERELKKVCVKEIDVSFLVDQMHVATKQAADRLLREHGGDLRETVRVLVDSPGGINDPILGVATVRTKAF